MHRKIQVTLEYTPAELMTILQRTLQVTNKVKISTITRTGDTITIVGEECIDPTKLNNGIESETLLRVLPGLSFDEDNTNKHIWKNKGLSAFIRAEFSEGHRIPIESLVDSCNKNGFEVSAGTLRMKLKSQFKNELSEVDPRIFQLTSVFEKKELVHERA